MGYIAGNASLEAENELWLTATEETGLHSYRCMGLNSENLNVLESTKNKEDSLPYLLHIAQALGVQEDQSVVRLGGVRHTPHPDALGFRLHCRAQRETYKGSGDTT